MSHPTTVRTTPAALLSLLLLATAGCCGSDETTATATGTGPPAAPVKVETNLAELETVPAAIRATGSVEPLKRVMPGTKIMGRVDRVHVREGDRVARGQALARLESRDLEAAVAQAEAAVAMAEAQLENAEAQFARMRDLHGRGSVTDKNLEDATAGQRVAAAGRAQAEANLAAAQVSLGYAEVKSPIAGWVTAKHVEAGDMAAPGTPFFTLEDLSRAKVTVQVPEAELAGVAAGAPATVEILGRELQAAVDRVVPAGDPQSRTFAVQLLLDNPDGALKSGMFARVRFAAGERQTLTVPSEAVVARGQLQGLFIVDGDRASLRWVRTGREIDGRTEILSGLDAGESYVLRPTADLADGARVTPDRVTPDRVTPDRVTPDRVTPDRVGEGS